MLSHEDLILVNCSTSCSSMGTYYAYDAEYSVTLHISSQIPASLPSDVWAAGPCTFICCRLMLGFLKEDTGQGPSAL